MRVGVIAVQGGFGAHLRALAAQGHDAVPVRYPAELKGIEGVVLPGGESTAQRILLRRVGLLAAIDERVRAGAPVLATCAGLIVAASPAGGAAGAAGEVWLDVTIQRNGWGPQVESFEAVGDRSGLPLVFIRAPRILDVGPEVEVLETFEGEPVLVRQGQRVGATFHPELSSDVRVAEMAFGVGARSSSPTPVRASSAVAG